MKHIKTILVITIVLFTVLLCGFKVHHDNVLYREWKDTRVIKTVVVGTGEGIDHFGYKYKPSWMDIREYRYYIQELNNLDSTMLRDGQRINIYVEAKEYTVEGLCLENTIITVDGNEWEYDNNAKGCAYVTFNDNGTADITDDKIIAVELRGIKK